jgi:hypothetical protein
MAKSREARSDLELLKDGLQEAYVATEVWGSNDIGVQLAYLAYDVLCFDPPLVGRMPSQFSAFVKRSCPSLKKLLKRRGYTLT